MHLVDEKSRGNFNKSGSFAFGCFFLFLLEPVDAKTPDLYCSLKRFHELFDSIVEFLEEYHSTLVEEVKRVRIDVAYLADIFEKLNTMNLQHQGNNITNLSQAHGIVLSFLSKLTMFRQNIARREFGHFPCMR